MIRTVNDVTRSVAAARVPELAPPPYVPGNGTDCVALAVTTMQHHMTDEGWQIMRGLAVNGYDLCGHGIYDNETDVKKILERRNVKTILVQDKREWDLVPGDFRDPMARFREVEYLKERDDIFKLTILKDAQQRPEYHRQSADEMGVHAWIIYYHPQIVKHVASYVRPPHLVRTTHSINPMDVPEFSRNRLAKAILSGAMNRRVYPLRAQIAQWAKVGRLENVETLRHPGYHRNGCSVPKYLKTLSRFKVAICTSSIYGYALRKILEATACGCRVITDLPTDEILHPSVEQNLTRVNSIGSDKLRDKIDGLCATYDPEVQEQRAIDCLNHYNYVEVTKRLAQDIETLRQSYSSESLS